MRIWEAKYDRLIDFDWGELVELLGDSGSPDNYRKNARFCVEEFRRQLDELGISREQYWSSKTQPQSNDGAEISYTGSNKSTISKNPDGSVTSSMIIAGNKNDLVDDIYLLKQHGYDPTLWKVKSSHHSWWNVQKKGGVETTFYASKLTVEKIEDGLSLEFVRKLLVENCNNRTVDDFVKPRIFDCGRILEVNISDLHLGKLAWGEECGENFDHKIASDRYKYIITDILDQVSHLEFDKIYFIWSNDFYHFDTVENTTTGGTRQDTDLRWQKLFRIGVGLLVWGIDKLAEKAPVETFYVGSNHDRMTSYYATNYLYAWYNQSRNVTVSYDCIARKYIEFGNVMIGFCHGSEEGKNISTIMAKEKPDIYGRTKFRYMQASHYHSSQSRPYSEDCGYEVRYLSSPTGNDSWHYSKGYIGAVKCGYGFVYDKKLGRRLEIRSNILT